MPGMDGIAAAHRIRAWLARPSAADHRADGRRLRAGARTNCRQWYRRDLVRTGLFTLHTYSLCVINPGKIQAVCYADPRPDRRATTERNAMKTMSYYPVIMTANVAETVAFYTRHVDFRPLFESDWYVHLQSNADARTNLAILDCTHETILASARGQRAAGLLLNFEVEDVDAVHARMQAAGVADPAAVARRSVRPAPFHHRRSQRRDAGHHPADSAEPRVRRLVRRQRATGLTPQLPQPPSAQPAAAQASTTPYGGSRQAAGATSASSASAKSAGAWIALVQTGEYSAATSRPTTAAFTPASAACAPASRRRRSPERQRPKDQQERRREDRHEAEHAAGPARRRRAHRAPRGRPRT